MPKSMTLTRTARGLYSQYNPLTEAPEGALLDAENCVIDREGVVGKRRGFDRYGSVLTDPKVFLDFKDTLLVLDGTTIRYDSDGAGAWSAWTGSFTAPDAENRVRFLEVRSNLYFTTDEGVKKNDALANNPTQAGMPQGLDVQTSLVNSGSGWFSADGQVSYRIVWGREDANRFLVLGTPSTPEVVTNGAAGTTDDVQLVFTIPDDVVAGDFYEIHRTEASATASTVPGDEHFRVTRQEVTAGEVTAGTVTYTDALDEAFLGVALYTNATQETRAQSNDVPPFVTDLTLWKGHVWYANSRREHEREVQMVSVPALDETFVITSGATVLTYTAKAAESIGSQEFQRFTGGTTSENLRDTAKSLVRVINRDSTNTDFYAYYTSLSDDPPGKVLIRRRKLNLASFSLTSSGGSAYEPVLPSSGTSVESDDSARKNRLHYSKFEQPEAVPRAANSFAPGSEESEIIRVLALRDSLIILKEEGVWRIAGESETSFVLKPLDPSTRILAPETAAVLNNAVWCLSTQGVVRIDEGGVAIVSRPIEPDISRILSYSNYKTLTHAVSYESERKYLLFAQSASSDTAAQEAWCYNYLTQSWTKWLKPATAGLVLFETDTLFLAHADDKFVLKERKSLSTSNDDYRDEGIGVTVTATGTVVNADGVTVTTATVTYTYTGATLAGGWLFEQGTWEAKVINVTDLGGDSYTLELEQRLGGVTTGAATLSQPISSKVRWVPEDANNPAVSKQWTWAHIYLEENAPTRNILGIFTDVTSDQALLTAIVLTPNLGWGQGAWGDFPWGDMGSMQSTPLRVAIPRQHQRARTLSVIYKHSWAKERFDILALALTVRPYSDRTVRAPA